MARICMISGKRPLTGNKVSHAHNKSKRRQYPNLQNKKIYIPELKKSIRLRVSTSTLRSIDKIGFMNFVKKYGLHT